MADYNEGVASTLLDLAAVAELRDTVGVDAFDEIVALYRVESADLVRQLHDAVTGRDPRAVAELAHSLRTSSATVGAYALANVCNELEAWARDGDLDRADELSRSVQLLHASSVDALALALVPDARP